MTILRTNTISGVGTDGPIFDGDLEFNSQNYVILPKGTTDDRVGVGSTTGALRYNTDSNKVELYDGNQWVEVQSSRPDLNGGARGVFAGGFNGPSPAATSYNTIDYINIASTGDAQDFGDLTAARNYQSAFASSTRGIVTGGNPVSDNRLDYITIASTGNAQDFGDALYIGNPGSLANSTRGIFAGGESPVSPNPVVNNINYVTIASIGNAVDFGDLITSTNTPNGAASKTRGIFSGGSTPSTSNTIQFITIATTGNSQDFGDLTITKTASNGGSCSNGIRALHPGGVSGPARVNSIEYITIATTGNGVDYGDLTSARDTSPCSSTIRGIFGGGGFPSQTNAIDYVNIATQSNAIDFGDLTVARSNIGSFSNGHGGL